MRWHIPALLFALYSCIFAHAQDATTGALAGTVRDSRNAAVTDAQISLVNTGRHTQTLPDGRFYLFNLAPGIYALTVTSQGFATQQVSNVTVQLGESTTVSITLQPSTVRAEAHVEAIAEDAPTSLTVFPAQVQELPVDSNRWQSFALLAPTVTATDSMQQQLSFGGMATAQNTYLLNGADDTRSFTGEPRGGARIPLRQPQAAVREFRIHPTDYTTAMGQAAGGVIATITDRGSNRFSGSAFFQYRGNLLAAKEPFAIATRYNNGAPTNSIIKPNDTRPQWGIKLAGPATHDLYYLFAYEEQRRNDPAISTPLNSSFYNLTATQTALLQNRGLTLTQIHNALAYLDSLSGKVSRHADTLVLFPRIDWDHNADHIMLSWNHARSNSPAGVRSRTAVARGVTSFGDDFVNVDDITARWTHTFTPQLIHQLSVSISRDEGRQQAQQPLPQEPHSGPNGFSPQVSIQGEFTLGKPATLGRRRYPDERRAQLFEILSWAGPQSLLQTGFALNFTQEHIETLQNEEGSYTYSSETTNGHAGGLVDFITDYTFSSSAYPNGACPAIYATVHYFCFRSFTQSFGRTATNWNTLEAAAFLQHHWHPSRSITLDAGLRYEYVQLPASQHPNSPLDAIFGNFATTSTLPADTNNLAPRIAVAWTHGEQNPLAVRLSYGIYFGRIAGATVWQALSRTAQPQSTYSIHLGPRTIVDAACASSGTNFGYPATYACPLSGTALQTTSAMLFARNFQAPMVQRAQLSIEQQLHSVVIKAAYLGTAARQLPNSTDINIAPSTQTAAFRIIRTDGRGEPGVRNADTFVLPLYTSRISPSYGPVTAILSNATAASHALVLAAQRPLRNGFSIMASWTYSKTLDYGQSHSAIPDTNGQLDPFDVRYDRAPSDLDHRHRILATVIAQPHLRNIVLNHWTLAATFNTSTGRPYSYLITGGTNLNGGRDSINGAGGLRYLPSVGRNTLHLPWQQNTDLRLSRELTLHEKLRARIYADGFNLFNHTSITGVQQRAFLVGATNAGVTELIYQDTAAIAAEGLNTQPFGTFTESGNYLTRARAFQTGLRLEW